MPYIIYLKISDGFKPTTFPSIMFAKYNFFCSTYDLFKALKNIKLISEAKFVLLRVLHTINIAAGVKTSFHLSRPCLRAGQFVLEIDHRTQYLHSALLFALTDKSA